MVTSVASHTIACEGISISTFAGAPLEGVRLPVEGAVFSLPSFLIVVDEGVVVLLSSIFLSVDEVVLLSPLSFLVLEAVAAVHSSLADRKSDDDPLDDPDPDEPGIPAPPKPAEAGEANTGESVADIEQISTDRVPTCRPSTHRDRGTNREDIQER
jgi:hypothetical protein